MRSPLPRACALLILAMGCNDAARIPDARNPVPADARTNAPDAAPTVTPDAAPTVTPDAAPAVTPGADTMVMAFDAVPVHFTSTENRRNVDVTAAFPATGAYSRIVLHLALDCPNARCDPWDRFGSLGVVTGPDKVIELARFMTPYRLGARWDIDVTDLRPLLGGSVALRVFIDTWVGPGSQYGDGWLFTAWFEMTGGVPAKLPIAVAPIWTMRQVPYGDPARPIDTSLPPLTLQLPPGSSHAVRTFVTGHGQGNADNCAEFCPRQHTLTAGGEARTLDVWRTDCPTTAVPNQPGTWMYPRAGWCPGAMVHPWTVDLPAQAAPVTIAYDVADYVNTCRPEEPVCLGCTLGTGCAYDGGSHTEPHYQVSSLLITYQ
jgi:hypothetical protein